MGYTVIKDGQRDCITCREVFALSEFNSYAYKTKQGKRSRRYDSRCKSCAASRRIRDYQKHVVARKKVANAYKKKNKAEIAAKVAQYRKNNPEIIKRCRVISEQKRRAGSTLTAKESRVLIERVLEEARIGELYLDCYTNELIAKPQIDHIVPLARGGRHEYENLCVTSGAMNSSKKDNTLVVWLATR